MAYQPIFPSSGAAPVGWEALLRVDGVSATLVLGLARGMGVLKDVEALIIERVLQESAAIPAGRLLSINVSNDALSSVRCLDALRRFGREIVVELQDRRVGGCLRQIKLLRQDGIQLAIDDFGQTLDDFSLVDVLKASYLKTDRSLLRCSPAWLQDIVAAGRKAGLKMVIEGIETEEEARRFGSLGDFNQGFFYGEPLPIEEVAT